MKKNLGPPAPGGELVLYQAEDGQTRVQCRFDEGTIWLTQAQIAELFQTSIPNINAHIKGIYAEKELPEKSTIKSYLIVRKLKVRVRFPARFCTTISKLSSPWDITSAALAARSFVNGLRHG